MLLILNGKPTHKHISLQNMLLTESTHKMYVCMRCIELFLSMDVLNVWEVIDLL